MGISPQEINTFRQIFQIKNHFFPLLFKTRDEYFTQVVVHFYAMNAARRTYVNTIIPRDLNAYYLLLIATDGTKLVFSWNELFNNETGNHIFIVTEEEGKRIKDMEKRIWLVCTGDEKAGRRMIRGLQWIHILQAEVH